MPFLKPFWSRVLIFCKVSSLILDSHIGDLWSTFFVVKSPFQLSFYTSQNFMFPVILLLNKNHVEDLNDFVSFKANLILAKVFEGWVKQYSVEPAYHQ